MYFFPTRDEMVRAICKPGMRIGEVGVWLGEFAHVLLGTLPQELVLIDPWAGKVQSGNADGNNVRLADLDAVYPQLVEHFSKISDRVKIHRGLSYDVLAKYPDNYFDVLYIDGDHSLEGCSKDLEIAYKKVKPGGWIMGHDYDMNELKAKNVYCFGVNQAVDTFCLTKGQKIAALGLDGCVSYAIPLKK